METSNQKLADIFGNNYFRIPDYQRGYAWKADRQLTDLWDDIEDIQVISNGGFKPHYTGALSLQRIPKDKLSDAERKLAENGSNFYDIVDGQQRITTILILIFELYKKLNKKELLYTFIRDSGKNSVYKFAYGDVNSNNNHFLKRVIFEDQITLPSTSNVYTNNLREAKKFFYDKFEPLKRKDVVIIKTKVMTALMFDIKIIDDNFDVQAVFETMNNRGKPLTILEKLKNRLLFLNSKLIAVGGDELAKTINLSWGTIYEYLGKNEDTMLDEDEFLSSHLTLIRTPADYSFSYQDAEKKVFEMFCGRAPQYNKSYAREQAEVPEKEDKVTDEKIREYVIDIANYVPLWYKVYFPDLNTEIGSLVYQIRCMNDSKEMKLFLAQLLSYEKTYSDNIIHCLGQVKKILFRNRLPTPSIKDERTFAKSARELHLKETTLQELIKELDSTLLKTPVDCQSLIDGYKWLFSYVRGNIGYYRWSGLKFFLFEYEHHVHKNDYSKDFPVINWEQFYDTSIEHIMPKTYETYWKETMNSYEKGLSITEDDKSYAHNVIINTLGNLTIISDKKNSSLGNNPWAVKVKAYSSGSFSEREISDKKKWHPWSALSIKERGQKMLNFLFEYLDIEQTISDKYVDEMLFTGEKYAPNANSPQGSTKVEELL